MKNLNILLSILLICGTLFSCQKESIEVISEANSNLSIEQYQNATNNLIITDPEANRGSTISVFEGKMEWASYIIGEILFNDSTNSYRGYFLNKSTIPLEELIGATPFSDTFKESFIDLLDYHINNNSSGIIGCPGGQEDKPRSPIQNETTNSFINSLIEDNCVELYFPIDMDFSQEDTLTTLSHPLNINAGNDGIKHYLNGCGEYDTIDVWVNPNYIFAGGNINTIVLRPVRNLQCSYDEYVFDFTDFLYF